MFAITFASSWLERSNTYRKNSLQQFFNKDCDRLLKDSQTVPNQEHFTHR